MDAEALRYLDAQLARKRRVLPIVSVIFAVCSVFFTVVPFWSKGLPLTRILFSPWPCLVFSFFAILFIIYLSPYLRLRRDKTNGALRIVTGRGKTCMARSDTEYNYSPEQYIRVAGTRLRVPGAVWDQLEKEPKVITCEFLPSSRICLRIDGEYICGGSAVASPPKDASS